MLDAVIDIARGECVILLVDARHGSGWGAGRSVTGDGSTA